jgi:hypothetical protein
MTENHSGKPKGIPGESWTRAAGMMRGLAYDTKAQ